MSACSASTFAVALGAALLGLAGATPARAVAVDDAQPVDPASLEGRRLVAPDANFSIEAPGEDWEWLAGQPTGASGWVYYCRHRERGAYFQVRVSRDRSVKLTPAFVGELVGEMKEPFEKRGFRTHLFHQAVSTPIAGRSYRIRGEAVGPDGTTLELHGHVVGADRFYMFFYSEAQPASFVGEFEGTVASFRLLKKSPFWDKRTKNLLRLAGTAVVIAIAAAVGLWRRYGKTGTERSS